MASNESLSMRSLNAKGTVLQKNDDEPIAIRLRYIGSGTVTSVTVVTATSVEIITSNGGTDTYLFATYTTIGALADAINADGVFEAKVLDALRSDASDNFLLAAAPITAGTDDNGVVVYDVVFDTSASKALTVCLSLDRNINTGKVTEGHRVHIQEVSYYANVNAAAADSVRIYQRVGSTETQIYGATSVDATVTTITFASGEGKITGGNGDELVVRVLDATSLTDDAANYLRVTGILE